MTPAQPEGIEKLRGTARRLLRGGLICLSVATLIWLGIILGDALSPPMLGRSLVGHGMLLLMCLVPVGLVLLALGLAAGGWARWLGRSLRTIVFSLLLPVAGWGLCSMAAQRADSSCVREGTGLLWSYPAEGAVDIPIDSTVWVRASDLTVERATPNGASVEYERPGGDSSRSDSLLELRAG